MDYFNYGMLNDNKPNDSKIKFPQINSNNLDQMVVNLVLHVQIPLLKCNQINQWYQRIKASQLPVTCQWILAKAHQYPCM